MKKILPLVAALLLTGAGCIQVSTSGSSAANDGGLWKSLDKGVHWTQRSAIAAVGTAKSFSGANVTSIAFDPSDSRALYLGTADVGLYYSYDGGDSWTHADTLGQVHVTDVAVHPSQKCTIFVATANRVARTVDCSRTWENVYVDTRPTTQVSDIMTDIAGANAIYAGTTAGDLLKSTDNGSSWAAVQRFTTEITQVVMSKADPRVMFVVTKGKGLWKTEDSGTTWTDFTSHLTSFPNALNGAYAVEDRATANSWLLASNFGLLRTTDGGVSWVSIPLLTPSGSATIYSLAVNPKNSNEIWYGTVNTLYHSVNGGAKWTTARMPTSRIPAWMKIDPASESVLYMGTTQPAKKSTF